MLASKRRTCSRHVTAPRARGRRFPASRVAWHRHPLASRAATPRVRGQQSSRQRPQEARASLRDARTVVAAPGAAAVLRSRPNHPKPPTQSEPPTHSEPVAPPLSQTASQRDSTVERLGHALWHPHAGITVKIRGCPTVDRCAARARVGPECRSRPRRDTHPELIAFGPTGWAALATSDHDQRRCQQQHESRAHASQLSSSTARSVFNMSYLGR